MSISEREPIDFVAFGMKESQGFEDIGIPDDQLDEVRLTAVHDTNGQPADLIVATPSGNHIFPIEELKISEIDGTVSRFRMVVNSLKDKASESSEDARAFAQEHETGLKTAAVIGGVALTGIAVSIAVIRKRHGK